VGRVVNRKTRKGIPGLRVEAWDKDLIFDDFVGQTVTDDNGEFTLEFESSYYKELCFDRKPDIYFKIYLERELIHSTEDSVLWNVANPDIRITIPVPMPVPEVPDDYSFFHKNNWFTRRGMTLGDLTEKEHEYIARLLNRYLHSKILETIGPGKPGLKELFKSMAIDYRKVKDSDLKTVIIEALLLAARRKKGLEDEIEEMETILEGAIPIPISDLLFLDLPLREHPVVAKDFRKAKAFEFARIIELDDECAARLAAKDLDLDNANEAVLRQFVEEDILDEKQKKDLRLIVDLSRLSGENIGLIKALKKKGLQSMKDLILWDRGDWTRAIKDNQIPLPEGEKDVDSYAENMRINIEKTFPTEYLLKRVIRDQYDSEINLINSIKKLLDNNDVIIDGTAINLKKLNWKGISRLEKKRIEKDLEQLLTLANTYSHLGLTEIVNNKKQDVGQKKTSIAQRLSNLAIFYKNNPDLDLYLTDFVDKDANLNWTNIEENERPLVRKQMMAFQRTLTLTSDYGVCRDLLAKGFDSAFAIVNSTETDFVSASGLSLETGRIVYREALNNSIVTSHFWEAIRDAQFGLFKDIALSNQNPVVNDLRRIDGFEELFGNQDYCDCEHCKSILGPAAYFVDLMYFVHSNVSQKAFLPDLSDHPLYLENRRPDLWNLKLSCPNTTTEIPYLEVVNDVLEQYLENQLGIDDVYRTLSKSDLAITLPFNLPLEELRLYLGHFELELFDLYKTLDEARPKQLREKLRISEQELDYITTPDTDQAKKIFGNNPLDNFDVQDFIRMARITRDQLDDLLNIESLSEVAKVYVKSEKMPDDIQQYNEVLKDLSEDRLDLIHRFLRLWKKTGWTIREFDLALDTLKLDSLEENDGDGNPKILQISQLIIIQKVLSIGVEEVCAMAGDIPQRPVEDNRKSLYERLFDLEKLFGPGFDPPTLPADKSKDSVTPLMLAGLSITESDLDALFGLFHFDTSIDQEIDVLLLSKLYRHVCIAKGLKLSIEDLINAIKLKLNITEVSQLIQIHDLIRFINWLNVSPFTISDLMLILEGKGSSSLKFQHDAHSVAAAVLEIQKTEKYTEKTAAEKVSLLVAYLRRTFNLTERQLFDEFLAKLISTDINGASILTALDANFIGNEPDNFDDFTDLIILVREIERIKLLFDKLQFEAESITFFVNNQDVFGIADLKHFTPDDVQNAVFYKSLLEQKTDMNHKLREMLKRYQANGHFSDEDMGMLSDLWKQPQELLLSIKDSLNFSATALPAVKFLWQALQICLKLSIEGHSLIKLVATDYRELQTARDIALGAFASRYSDETDRRKKLEPYIDKTNTLKRDALCDYIIACRDRFKFNGRDELYKFFLLDVEMSGCFRTSKVVAAISSVQLYIHRCLINIERSDDFLNPDIVDIKVDPTCIPGEEWEWRKNYRVWEANRKVFLYPENYIDPTLRDNKTNIFRELEDELLQEKITEESAEAAYKKYVSQFVELTKLRYAGAYYHSISDDSSLVPLSVDGVFQVNSAYILLSGVFFDNESEDSVYYLFARTNVQPYQYYYRTYNHYKNVWGNWEKIEQSIEAEEISSLVHRGKLYIYWTEVKSKEINKIQGGDSESEGAIFKVYVKYSFLDENGKWSPPQRLYIGHTHFGEERIFRRVLGCYPNEDERERKHDYVFEQFERKVFRKPYARLNNDTKVPVKLSYIWTQNHDTRKVKYIPASISPVEFRITFYLGTYIVKISLPSVEFIVENNQFGLEEKRDGSSGLFAWNAVFHLPNSVHCIVSINLKFMGINVGRTIIIPVTAQELPIIIYASTFDQSLSDNRILNSSESDIKDNDGAITHSTFSFLQNEYTTAYAANEDFAHYVEDGTKNFTNTFRIISQTQTGVGHLLTPSINGSNSPVILTTILTDELSDILFGKGLEQFLSPKTQQMPDFFGQQFNLNGSYGQYYWEMFFHIPFLIANHLNANHKYKEAKWWYERIFNPTASEKPDSLDHNWQFRAFRNLDIQKLKDILIDHDAIEAYKKDPFNPHAIARLRLSAYQKTIVMKYIDNLIDWGDHLFAQDNRESINEAEMLYHLAADILGKRPVKMGKCDIAKDSDLNYRTIGPKIGKDIGSEFLITLENYYLNTRNEYRYDFKPVEESKSLAALQFDAGFIEKTTSLAAVAKSTSVRRMSDYVKISPQPEGEIRSAEESLPRKTLIKDYWIAQYSDIVKLPKGNVDRYGYGIWTDASQFKDKLKIPPLKRLPGVEVVKNYSMVFCVPHNEYLLKYWGRVEDRLNKIRNCMNISGVRRSLALFQPPIDPMMLVRAQASGLSLEDITALIDGSALPPYRFNYLLEKTRQFIQTVQGFGNSLLSALEKKDVEELTLLRSVHERNILKMTKTIKKNQLQEAQHQAKAMEETLINVQNRIDYYKGLVSEGLTGWERTQQIAKHTGTGLIMSKGVLDFIAGIIYAFPQIGSPFAMKYGGKEQGDSTANLADWLGDLASVAAAISASAGLEATFQRREQEWRHQLELAEQEIKQVEKQKVASEVRCMIAEKDLEMHEKSMEQADELYDFYKSKFTNLGLYNYLTSTLNRLYREAYNLAYNMAKKAERAYQFEQDDDNVFIANDNWQFDRAGLLAGERLLLQLQKMEQVYLEKNVRKPEITQSFSLALLNPSELLNLRQTGECIINIPEIAFEIFYPGQYKRLIKSIRLTIPCVAGPYTNVSGKLTLVNNKVELEDGGALIELLIGKNSSISTSSGNNDAGMFEFNFRDERYLPFEGCGAISAWSLKLPSKFRPFDYDTISDVILHISYTAQDGDRDSAEDAFLAFLKKNPQEEFEKELFRLFSLKYEFSTGYHKLLNSPVDTAQSTEFSIGKKHFPYFLIDKDLIISKEVKVFLKPKKGSSVATPVSMIVNGNNSVIWNSAFDIPMPGSDREIDKIKAGRVKIKGSPIRIWNINAGIAGLNKEDLDDILILVQYNF
jgi:hypothetical protein